MTEKMPEKTAWWQNTFLKIKDGKLAIGERTAEDVAEAYGTPLFVYSKKQVLSNFRSLRRAFQKNTSKETRILYAMKANFNPELLKILREEGAWIDAVSPGEVQKAIEGGFIENRILFTGTSVSDQDLRQVFQYEGVTVNIDAEEQLELMKEVKERWYPHQKIKVSVRWNPGIGRGFSPKAITAGSKSPDQTPIKFGIEEQRVLPTFEKAMHYGFLPVGFHQHLGSGWVKGDFEAVQSAVDKMIVKAEEIQKQGFKLEFLDFGGGFGPQYYEDQGVFPVEDYIADICQKVAQSDLEVKTLAVEPGKYLVGDAGILLLRVEYMKSSYGNIFACVNAGTFNTVPRPVIYAQAQHAIINCARVHSDKMTKVTVAGNLCETGDVFGKEVLMPLPQRGDFLALLCAGAYCRSMASSFNLRKIPKEVII